MSDPIQETTETNSSRRKGLEAWAASIAARQRPPEQQAPENDGSGPAYARPGTAQRPQKVKTVTKIQKNHQAQKNSDGVMLSRNNKEAQTELSIKDARQLMKNVGVAKAESATGNKTIQAPPPPPVAQTREVKAEKALEQAAKTEAADEARVVTAEEVQQSPTIAATVAQKSVKSSGKSEETEDSKATSESEATDEDKEAASLIKPGNDPKASAYVRAGDYLPNGTSNPDLNDFMLAL